MQLFLAIDTECLDELASMTDEILPVEVAPTHKEYVGRIRTRPGRIWAFGYHTGSATKFRMTALFLRGDG